MIAGTLVQLDEPAEEALDSTFHDGNQLPALEVSATQSSFDNRPIQRGKAAGTVKSEGQDVFVSEDSDGDRRIIVERAERTETVVTDWVADVTGSGLIAIESVQGPGEFDFPLDLFAARTGRRVKHLNIDVENVHAAWNNDGVLGNVWMRSADAGDGASIDYHQQATADKPATIGFGFERPWNSTVMEGVIYEGGYIAVYNETRSTAFIRFVEEEILPFTDVAEDETIGQSELNTSQEPECDGCGRETDSVDSSGLCIVCRDKEEEDSGTAEFQDLDTVTVTDGGEE